MQFLIVSAITAIIVSGPALALRGVDRDTRCDRIPDIEAELGSQLSSDETSTENKTRWLSFEGRSNGRGARILYHCDLGKPDLQLITVTVESEHEGEVVFSDWHREISARLGPPFKDLDEPRIREMEEATNIHPMRRVALWSDGEHVVGVTLWGRPGAWEVSINGP